MISGRRIFILLYAASGAAALVYEVTWTRQLTLQLGHTVAAASTVLAAFMGGLAIGAWAAGRRSAASLRTYALLELGVAATALVLPTALAASVPLLARAYADGRAPAMFAVVRVAVSLLLVGIPAAAMGATFPIATAWFTGTGARGNASAAASLYAANTTGAAAGAIAAGFFLIPAIGLRATTWVGVALNVVAAGGAWWLSTQIEPDGTTVNAETAKPAKENVARSFLRSSRALRSPLASPTPINAESAERKRKPP